MYASDVGAVKRPVARVIACAALLGVLSAAAAPPRAPTKSLALVGGRVYTSPDGPPIDDASVVLQDGVITGVGPRATIAVPHGATTIDCKGLTVSGGSTTTTFTSPVRTAGVMRRPFPPND